jgi:PEP-CTERM motif
LFILRNLLFFFVAGLAISRPATAQDVYTLTASPAAIGSFSWTDSLTPAPYATGPNYFTIYEPGTPAFPGVTFTPPIPGLTSTWEVSWYEGAKDLYTLSFSTAPWVAVNNEHPQFAVEALSGTGAILVNNVTTDISGTFTVAAAIPEPETYAIVLAGLSLLGWVGRRREQQAA